MCVETGLSKTNEPQESLCAVQGPLLTYFRIIYLLTDKKLNDGEPGSIEVDDSKNEYGVHPGNERHST